MSLRPKAPATSAWSQGEQAAVDVERRLLEARMTRQAKEPAIAAGSCRLLARERRVRAGNPLSTMALHAWDMSILRPSPKAVAKLAAAYGSPSFISGARDQFNGPAAAFGGVPSCSRGRFRSRWERSRCQGGHAPGHGAETRPTCLPPAGVQCSGGLTCLSHASVARGLHAAIRIRSCAMGCRSLTVEGAGLRPPRTAVRA